MLRDLGGLAYEVHRTGGGDFTAHSGVIGGKIERLALLDSEAHAIEQALGAPRSETIVFEPGVGGTCDVCGELFGSAAKYCSHCGTPTDPAARATPAPAEPAHEPRHVPPMPKSPGTGETAVLAPAAAEEGAPAARADETGRTDDLKPPADETGRTDDLKPPADETGRTDDAASRPADETGRADETGAAAEPHEAAAEAPADRQEERGVSNGRVEEPGRPSDLSAGDPLATREPRE